MASASRALWLLVLTLALCQAVTAQPVVTAQPLETGPSYLTQQIMQTFQEFNSLSETLHDDADYISSFNAYVYGRRISRDLSKITNKVDKAISLLEGVSSNDDSTLSDDDAKLVVSALTRFVQVHSLALDAVINKHGLVGMVIYVEDIRQALLNLEEDINDFAKDLVYHIPTQAGAANKQLGILGVNLHEAIAVYEEPLLNAATTLFKNN